MSIRWHLRQLLPMTYVSEYREDGEWRVSVWRMWLGRYYDVRTWVVKETILTAEGGREPDA